MEAGTLIKLMQDRIEFYEKSKTGDKQMDTVSKDIAKCMKIILSLNVVQLYTLEKPLF